MGNSITIIPIRKKGADRHTLAGSLEQNGMNRAPGCGVTVPPYKEINGEFRTGLDPNATYIKLMPKEEQEIEIARVTALRDKLQALTGLDLGPRAPYYTKMTDGESGTPTRAQMAKLRDEEMILDFTNPQTAITAAWLMVHPQVASSYEAYKRSPNKSQIQFYVSNPEAEAKITYDEKKAINRIIVQIDGMSPSSRKRIARLLDLPVNESSMEENVYNLLDNFIKQGEVKSGPHKGRRATHMVEELLSMKEETLNIKDLVKQAFQQGVYRRHKGVVFEGEVKVADSEKALVLELTVKTEDRIALEQKVKSKKILTEE